MHLQTISNLVENLHDAGNINTLAYDRLVAEIATVEEQVHAGMTNLRKKNGHLPEDLYFFNMHRLTIHGTPGETITIDELKQAEDRKKVYVRVLAKNEKEAAITAGGLCGDPFPGTYWAFQTESISPVIPPELLSR